MQWKTISPKALLLSNGVEPIEYTVSLLQLVRQTLVEATTIAFFGPELLRTDPEFVDNFFHFDNNIQSTTPSLAARSRLPMEEVSCFSFAEDFPFLPSPLSS